ncbi:MAG: hypothetical protein KTR31_24680 [Myxococcales bacterium]|nr:hypothetical protein [Myxococcales bacterium]
MIALWASMAWAADCTFTADGQPTTRLDCSAPGAWRVQCTIPEGSGGKIRTRFRAPARSLEGEARVPLGADGLLDLPVKGPGGRAGAFMVRRAGAGLLAGQAVGPMQLCPVVQPGVRPGSPPVELAVEVWVSAHTQTGFASEEMDGGVMNRVPVYDAGRVVAKAQAVIVQLPVKDIPILEGTLPMLRDERVTGELRLRAGESWSTLTWAGSLRDEPVDSGDLVVLVVDFEPGAVEAAMGPGAAVDLLEDDLAAWMEGGYDSRLGLAAWRRSELRVPPAAGVPSFQDDPRGGVRWRRATLGNADLRVGARDGRARVVIARRAAPLDDAALSAIDAASTR